MTCEPEGTVQFWLNLRQFTERLHSRHHDTTHMPKAITTTSAPVSRALERLWSRRMSNWPAGFLLFCMKFLRSRALLVSPRRLLLRRLATAVLRCSREYVRFSQHVACSLRAAQCRLALHQDQPRAQSCLVTSSTTGIVSASTRRLNVEL